MAVSLNEETLRLIEDRMSRFGVKSADNLVRVALETLDGVEAGFLEDLDEETQSAILEGDAAIERGEGIPWEEARETLRRKLLGA